MPKKWEDYAELLDQFVQEHPDKEAALMERFVELTNKTKTMRNKAQGTERQVHYSPAEVFKKLDSEFNITEEKIPQIEEFRRFCFDRIYDSKLKRQQQNGL